MSEDGEEPIGKLSKPEDAPACRLRLRRTPRAVYQEAVRRVNLDPNEPFVGNRPPKLEGIQLIRRHDQRSPMLDLAAADEAAELERARKAQLEEKERSRAEHEAKLAVAAKPAAPAPKPVKAKPAKRK